MPNGTTTILPSPTGGGLFRGAQAFAAGKERGEERGLRERQIRVLEQSQAFAQLLQIAPILPPGSTIGENPFLSNLVDTAFGDFTPEERSLLDNLVLTPITAQTLIEDRTKFVLENLDPEDPESKTFLEAITLAKVGIGATSISQLEVSDQIAKITGSSLTELAGDARFKGNVARTVLGQTPIVEIPGLVGADGELLQFDSVQVANTYANLLIAGNEAGAESGAAVQEAMDKMITQLMEQAQEDGIGLGRGFAARIVNSYIASTDGSGVVNSAGLSPLEALYVDSTDNQRRMIKLFSGTIQIGESSFEQFLAATPGGKQIIMLGELGRFIGEEGLGLPSDQVRDALQDFLDSDIGTRFGITIDERGPLRERFNFDKIDNLLGQGVDVNADALRTAIGGSNLPPPPAPLPPGSNLDVVATANTLRSGAQSEESLRAEMGDAIVDAAIELNRSNR